MPARKRRALQPQRGPPFEVISPQHVQPAAGVLHASAAGIGA
jgi:hypothetical protein